MKLKDILTIGSVAAGTAALTVAIFWSRPTNAELELEGPAADISRPKLVCHEIELSVTTEDGKPAHAGENPKFTLAAHNKSATPQTALYCISVSSMAPESLLSRTVSLPRVIWTKEQMLTLAGNESRNIPFTVWTNLPVNQIVSIHLIDRDPEIALTTRLPAEPLPKSPVPPVLRDIVALSFTTGTNATSLLSL